MLWIIWSAAVLVVAQYVSRSAGVRTVETDPRRAPARLKPIGANGPTWAEPLSLSKQPIWRNR